MPSQETWMHRLSDILGVPPTEGNEVRVLRNGAEIFPAMLGAIDRAERTVDIVTFVYWSGDIARRFADALAGAARRGCRVRVLLDAIGAREMDAVLVDSMSSAGCDVRWFRPLVERGKPKIGTANHRTHRKILVCDGEIGFTGGVGIADEWDGDARNEGEWRDTHIRLRGPAVAGLQAGFIDNWSDEYHDEFDPSAEPLTIREPVGNSKIMVINGSSSAGASDLWRLMLTLVTCAEDTIRLASAYFNPDHRLIEAMLDAVRRGVQVQVLVPGTHADKRFVQMAGETTYEELLDGGVDVRNFDTSMMHAKIMTVDRTLATIGSANFNQRSLRHDEESNLVIFDRHVVSTLDDHYRGDLESSTRLDPTRWTDRGPMQRIGEKVVESVSSWL